MLLEKNIFTLFTKFNDIFFGDNLDCPVKWGRKYNKPRKRCIRLGSYNVRTNTITINPDLQNNKIPGYIVRYVLYHEMVHAWFHKTNHKDKLYHSKNFKSFEKSFPEYAKASKWLKKNKNFLLSNKD